MSGFSPAKWWGKTKQILDGVFAGVPDEPTEIDLLAWDEQSNSFRLAKRVLSKRSIEARVSQSLGSAPDSLDAVSDDEADALVQGLASLALKGN
jgi:hypothetical protein